MDRHQQRSPPEIIDCGQPGFALRPFTIGPDQIPKITDPGLAKQSPELALLSAMAHGGRPENRGILDAAIVALKSADEDQQQINYDITLAALSETAARTYLEKVMGDTEYVFQSDLAHRAKAQGEAHALLTVLAARGIAVSDSIRERIMTCRDLAPLDKWVTTAANARTAHELFA